MLDGQVGSECAVNTGAYLIHGGEAIPYQLANECGRKIAFFVFIFPDGHDKMVKHLQGTLYNVIVSLGEWIKGSRKYSHPCFIFLHEPLSSVLVT